MHLEVTCMEVFKQNYLIKVVYQRSLFTDLLTIVTIHRPTSGMVEYGHGLMLRITQCLVK